MTLFESIDQLTSIGNLIYNEDIQALEDAVSNGLDIHQPVDLTDTITDTPISFAVYENRKTAVKWLRSKKAVYHYADDDEFSLFFMACKNFDAAVVQLLIESGADVNSVHPRTNTTALQMALYGANYDTIPLLIEKGYDLKKDGVSLRQAVSDKQYKAVNILLSFGADVNFCKANMVFPENSTPVLEAARNNDLEMVQLLIRHGADVTIKNQYGERPYNIAVEKKNETMKNIFRSLEPEAWHQEEKRLMDLNNYNIPKSLLHILQSENRRMDLPDNKTIRYIQFHSLLDIKEVNWNGYQFLDLLSDADQYDSKGFLVWYPAKNCFAFADYEHDAFKELCSEQDLFAQPSKQIDKIFE